METVLDNMPWESADGLTQDQRDALRYRTIRDFLTLTELRRIKFESASSGNFDHAIDEEAARMNKWVKGGFEL